MSDGIKLKALKGFRDGTRYVPVGGSLIASELRARDLERNGLVARVNDRPALAALTATPKRRQTHRNKMAPHHFDKDA